MRQFIATGFWLASLPFGLITLVLVTIGNKIAGEYWKTVQVNLKEDDDE